MRISRLGWLGALLALALVASACGGSSDTASSDGDSGSLDTTENAESSAEADEPEAPAEAEPADEPEEPEPADEPADTAEVVEPDAPVVTDGNDCSSTTASARGVTADTINIGVSLLDFELLKSLNLSPFGWGDQELVWQTLFDDLNEKGGVACRQVNPIFAFYSPLGTADAEAKCLELTADNETFVVLFGFVGPAEPANTCIVGQQSTALFGGRITPERFAQATAPWIQLNSQPERKAEVLASLLDEAGELDGTSIAVVSAPATAESHQNVVDTFGDAGANIVLDFITEAATGDTAAEDTEWSSLTEVIRNSGVDTLILNGTIAAPIRNLQIAGVEVQYWTTDDDGLNNLGASISPDQAEGVLTVTEQTDAERWEDPGVIACTETVAAAHPEIAEELRGPTEREGDQEGWFSAVMSACSRVSLVKQILDAVGPDLTYDNLTATIETFGEFAVPGSPYNSLGAGKLDASDTFRLGVFDPTIGDSGEIAPIGPVVDVTN